LLKTQILCTNSSALKLLKQLNFHEETDLLFDILIQNRTEKNEYNLISLHQAHYFKSDRERFYMLRKANHW